MNRITQAALLKLSAVFLLFITAISALFSGLSLILYPDGHKIGLGLSLLTGTGFTNYLIPGSLLFGFIGLFGLFAAVYSAVNGRYYTLILLLAGLILTGWVMTEVLLLKIFNVLQMTFALLGLLLAAAALWLRKNLPGNTQ